ncbi:AAA family ATPase [Oceaniglobus trochenteri]|uniref:AAA family ATPase n=1 Tax=Oceaniglobus trochenteri TaxID=2763260 RepID=UPI001D0001F2|nr:AAA family ATPase [Oceaniglobus trochenteri]
MRRVMIVGGPGSGKSTLARDLGDVTGLPVCHMDLIHWKPGWIERPTAEKLPLIGAWESRDAWIIEGGLSRTYENRAARADTIIFLDLPLMLRLWRVVRRRMLYRGGQTRPDLPRDCPERLDGAFLRWIVSSSRRTRRRNLDLRDGAAHATYIHLRSGAAITRWLAGIAAAPSAG